MNPPDYFDLAMFVDCEDDMADEELDRLMQKMETTEIADSASA
jgi:hypothetical protein